MEKEFVGREERNEGMIAYIVTGLNNSLPFTTDWLS